MMEPVFVTLRDLRDIIATLRYENRRLKEERDAALRALARVQAGHASCKRYTCSVVDPKQQR